jgi:hypothetical protein
MRIDLQYAQPALVYTPAGIEDLFARVVPDRSGPVLVELYYGADSL